MQVPPTAQFSSQQDDYIPLHRTYETSASGPTWNLAFPLAFPLATLTVWGAALATGWQWPGDAGSG